MLTTSSNVMVISPMSMSSAKLRRFGDVVSSTRTVGSVAKFTAVMVAERGSG